ncbi:peptide deformylase [Candidatus Auribacterota bacterium]
MILDIIKYGNPVLRKKAERIEVIDEKIKRLAHDMIETMREEPGVGVAAPQVGEPVCLIVFEVAAMNIGPFVYVNPEIIEKKGCVKSEEGCLSVPEICEKVPRARYVKVKAKTLEGEDVVVEYSDLPAIVIQHEIDHINGILFIDYLNPIKRSFVLKKLKKLSSDDYKIK